jgi:hypothetical protein
MEIMMLMVGRGRVRESGEREKRAKEKERAL